MRRGEVYLEIGCGDALLPFVLSGFAREVLGLDVTDALVDFAATGQRRGTIPGPISDWRQGRQDGAACSERQDPATEHRAAGKGRTPCAGRRMVQRLLTGFFAGLLMRETSSIAQMLSGLKLRRLATERPCGRQNHERNLWSLINLEIFLRTFRIAT